MEETSITPNQGIKAEDLQMLLNINPLAAEQLKSIVVTRERDELLTKLSLVKVCSCANPTQLPLQEFI
jgi:hypothetical protein